MAESRGIRTQSRESNMTKLLDQIWNFFCFTMILIGITGLCWKAFGDDGWIEHLWGVAWDMELRHPILATPVIAGTLLLVALFLHGELHPGKVSRLHDLLIYTTMLAGVYFTLKFLLSGS